MSRYTRLTADLNGALEAMRAVQQVPARILFAQKIGLADVRRKFLTAAKKEIGSEYTLSAARIARGLTMQVTTDGLSLRASSRGINLIEFGATWQRVRKRYSKAERYSLSKGFTVDGVKYAVKRNEPREIWPESFIGTGKNGARLVFIRTSSKRLPLRSLYGPSVSQMLKHGGRPERLVDFAIRTLQNAQARLLGSTPP